MHTVGWTVLHRFPYKVKNLNGLLLNTHTLGHSLYNISQTGLNLQGNVIIGCLHIHTCIHTYIHISL